MNFQRLNSGLILLGGIVIIIGSLIGLAIGNAVGTPDDSCGWQVVHPTYSPDQIHTLVQGTAVPLLGGSVLSTLEDCSGPDPWLFAVLGAIPGVFLILSPLFRNPYGE